MIDLVMQSQIIKHFRKKILENLKKNQMITIGLDIISNNWMASFYNANLYVVIQDYVVKKRLRNR